MSEEDDQPCHKGENLDDIHKESEKIEPRSKLSSVTPLSSCVSPYTILKCVICERNVSDSNPGNVCFQMSTQMPLTTSSQTPVISKLNEVCWYVLFTHKLFFFLLFFNFMYAIYIL